MTTAGAPGVATSGDREIAMTRVLDAPRELVFNAWTKPELLKRWLLGPPGPRSGRAAPIARSCRPSGSSTRSCSTRTGPAARRLVTTVLADRDGRTTATVTVLYATRAARDAALGTGMEHGIAASYDRLSTLLASAPSTR